jgi:hypothetical protein
VRARFFWRRKMCKWMVRIASLWICFECKKYGRDGYRPSGPRNFIILPFLMRESWECPEFWR